MFFNATLLVLLVQNSVGIAAITRATIHGAVHTTWWFLVYATLAQIVDSVDTVPRLHMFLVAAGLDLGWWMMYFGGLELMNACLPDCCCIRGMLPQVTTTSAPYCRCIAPRCWSVRCCSWLELHALIPAFI